MSHQSELIATDIDAYLAEHERKDLLRLLTCGSVDDGKSTLIGRLLHDSHLVYEDHLAALQADNATSGHAGEALDLALLTDGLKAEREQGITIDVAYRYFSTARRKFIVADTPGHVQYTRNMVTGASTAQLAIVIVDARLGVLAQTKRHSMIASLLGIGHVVVCVNKMDLVGWSKARFEEIVADYRSFAAKLPAPFAVHFLPVAALTGDNVVHPSDRMAWYEGPTLMTYLETVDVTPPAAHAALRLPVQLVTRPDADFRGFAGTITAGTVRPGDVVTALPSGVSSVVARIVTFDGDLEMAGAGDAVTVTLDDEIDVSRGDVLVGDGGVAMQRSHRIEADVVWMAETAMKPGRAYLLQSVSGISSAVVPTIRHRLDVDTLATAPAEALELNDIARCVVEVDRELLFDPYETDRVTGSFILIDRLTNATVAAGMIRGRAGHWDAASADTLTSQASAVTTAERTARFAQQPVTVLLTGLTGAGKSAIASALERRLFDAGHVAVRLDGQNVRQGVSRDLGFTAPERSENVRRVAETAKLLNGQGLIAIAVMLAPDAEDRDRARDLVGAEQFIEVFVDTPIDICRQRDPGGLYTALDNGAAIDMPGITSPYEAPTHPDITVTDHHTTAHEAANAIMALLHDRGFVAG